MARARATPCRSPPESCPTIESGVEHFRGEADLAHQPLGFGALACAVEKADRVGQFASKEDVARNGLLDAERAVLEHCLNTGVARACGIPAGLALAAHQDLAARRLNRAGKHLDQRRLAGSIVTEQTHDLAAIDVKIDAADREHAAIALGDILELDQPFAHRRLFRPTPVPARPRDGAPGPEDITADPGWRDRRPPCSSRGSRSRRRCRR